MSRPIRLLTVFSLICLHLVTIGCATLGSGATDEPFQEKSASGKLIAVEKPELITGFPSLPFPRKFKFNRNKSFIYEAGSGTVKIGYLFFSGWTKLEKVILFYQNEMINKGWTLVQFVARDISTLHYEKENLDCWVTLASSLGKTEIKIVIGPK